MPEPTNELDSAACTACGQPWAAHTARARITVEMRGEQQTYPRAVDLGDCVTLLRAELMRVTMP